MASVFSAALRTLEARQQAASDQSWQERFDAVEGGAPSAGAAPPCCAPVPAPAPAAAAAPPLACCCGSAADLDKSFVVDPTLSATNACGYAVFQGLPPPGEFWAAAVAARCSAVVVLGHDERHVMGFFQNDEQSSIHLPDGRKLRCVHHVSFPTEGLVVRQLEVAGPSGAGELWINFLHLASWPDCGVPSSTLGMLRLCRELESCRRPGARIAVQCCCGTDAGLGACPAGAFIATDMLRQRLQALQLAPPSAAAPGAVAAAIDVPELVRSLRAQRAGLVETPRQYAFIHAALADEVRDGLRVERRLLPRGFHARAAAATEGGGGGGAGAGAPAARAPAAALAAAK
ncbi:MAG: protein-tyrosine phosphatase-like protein [Monoraphidium minutum]|nr:MAG: protein-tyrosine phosphatase-like protein [Monoraphidium minutum]